MNLDWLNGIFSIRARIIALSFIWLILAFSYSILEFISRIFSISFISYKVHLMSLITLSELPILEKSCIVLKCIFVRKIVWRWRLSNISIWTSESMIACENFTSKKLNLQGTNTSPVFIWYSLNIMSLAYYSDSPDSLGNSFLAIISLYFLKNCLVFSLLKAYSKYVS